MTLTEIFTVAGVLVSAGAALERMRRLENSNRDQGRRIGAVEGLVRELLGERRQLERSRPHRPLGAPFETHVLTTTPPRDEE
jgi:hypothetical protein